MEVAKYIDPNYRGPTLIRGYLMKLKSDSAVGKFFSKFNKRYFILDMNNGFFGYQDKESSSNLQKYPLTDLLNVDPNPRIVEVCDWKFGFVVEIRKRIYTLYADSVSVHNEWCCGLRACIRPIERLRPEELRSQNFEVEGKNEQFNKNYGGPPQYREIQTNNEPIYSQEEPARDRPIEYTRVPERNNSETAKIIRQNEEPQINSDKKTEYPPNPTNKTNQNQGPQFVMFKGDYEIEKEEPKPNKISQINKKYSDDDEDAEVKTIHGPIRKKNDDFEGIVPIVSVRDKVKGLPQEKLSTKEPVKEVEKNYEKFTVPKQPEIKNNPKKEESKAGTGIFDMYNELSNLGLENIEIRPLTRPKVKNEIVKPFKENSKSNSNWTDESTKDPPVLEKKHFSTNNAWEVEAKEETTKVSLGAQKKNALSNIAVRPTKNQNKPKYVEKPEVVPDEPELVPQKKVENPKNFGNSHAKKNEKTEYKEANSHIKPQGHDADWENWDD